jgi:hypothetical protein
MRLVQLRNGYDVRVEQGWARWQIPLPIPADDKIPLLAGMLKS